MTSAGRFPFDAIGTFGSIDAEVDFDPAFFVPSETWNKVLARDRQIVIGRKGTGKTAIRLALLDRARQEPLMFVTDLRFRDYPWNVQTSIFSTKSGSKARYTEPWLFLMLVELAKLAIGKSQAPIPTDDGRAAAKAVREFIHKNWGSLQFDYRDIFTASQYKVVKTLKLPAGSMEWQSVARSRLGDSLSSINRWLMECLALLIRADESYYLIFDELDIDFRLGDDRYADNIAGLLIAAQHFTQWSRQTDLRAIPVILIRDDIFTTLIFSDKNKIFMTMAELLRWDYHIDAHVSLKTVIDARLRVLLDLPRDGDVWAQVWTVAICAHATLFSTPISAWTMPDDACVSLAPSI
jgi:hypothetical protein